MRALTQNMNDEQLGATNRNVTEMRAELKEGLQAVEAGVGALDKRIAPIEEDVYPAPLFDVIGRGPRSIETPVPGRANWPCARGFEGEPQDGGSRVRRERGETRDERRATRSI